MTALLLASHDWHHHDGGWFPIFPLLFLTVLVAVLVFRRPWRYAHGPTAESVLAERYARGEIDEAEYRERRAVLRRKD